MRMYFSKEHMQTLKELQIIAKKHNHRIEMGFSSYFDYGLDLEILKKNKVHFRVIAQLENAKDNIQFAHWNCQEVFFNLIGDDGQGGEKYNIMTYQENETHFALKPDFSNEVLNDYIEKNDSRYFDYHYEPTIIYGFGYKESIVDYRVYRPGMALKYFSDLVCDYLGEERIKRVY